MIGAKSKGTPDPPVYFFKYVDGDFVLSGFNDAALEVTEDELSKYVGKSITDLTSSHPEIQKHTVKCFRRRSVVKSTQACRFMHADKDAFFACTYVYIPVDQVAVVTEWLFDVDERDSENAPDTLNNAARLAHDKDVALREVLDHQSRESAQLRTSFQRHIDVVVMPLINRLEQRIPKGFSAEFRAIRKALAGAVSTFTGDPRIGLANLSPREIQICELIRNGYQSKEIAALLNISVRTVSKVRQNTRRKLKIKDSKIGLQEVLLAMSNTE